MITYGQYKTKAAFKMYCRAENLEFELANKISKQIDEYEEALKHAEEDEKEFIKIEDYVAEEYIKYIEASKDYEGIIDNISPSPCFVENTKILTKDGYKNIQDIKSGDYVLTHTNTYQRVVTPMKKKTDSIFNIKVMGNIPIKVTGEHPFYVRSYIKDERYWDHELSKWRTRRLFSEPYWKEARDLQKGDFIGRAICKEEYIHPWENEIDYGCNRDISTVDVNNNDFWWVIGRYIGDGWHTKNVNKKGHINYYRVTICCNKNGGELEEITTKLQSSGFKFTVVEEATVYKISISSKDLFYFVHQFGTNCYNKKLTKTILDLPVDKLRAFLQGYFSADGHYIEESDTQTCCSVSYELILGIQYCVQKAYNVGTRITIKKAVPNHEIEGRTVNTVDGYDLRFNYKKPKTAQWFEDGDYIWQPFRTSEELSYDGYVYNMSVENDESYTADNIIVHNCSFVLLNEDIREEIGITRIRKKQGSKNSEDILVANITGKQADELKYLKNDILVVTTVFITSEVCKRIGIKQPSVRELIEMTKNRQDIFDKVYWQGNTVAINQIEQPNAIKKVKVYKPKSIEEITAFVSSIRPSFKSAVDNFLNRRLFSYNIPAFDKVIAGEYQESSYILYQESIMQALSYAGIPSDQTYTIIKAISKKKEELIKSYKDQFLDGFKSKAGCDDNTSNMVWKIIEDASAYGLRIKSI